MWHVGDETQVGLWPLVSTDGIRMHVVGLIKHHHEAIRIADLLNLHGLEQCDTNDLADALLDLEQRTEPGPVEWP